MNSTKRMWAKSITWRVFALAVLATTTYVITGDGLHTSAITIVYNLIQIFMYFAHEWIWNKIGFGRRDNEQARGS